MKPAPFHYHAPATLDEAMVLLRDNEDARPLAGGQSLVAMLALRIARPTHVVDLNRIASLSGIELRDDILRIGAMTRQVAALRSAEVLAHAPLLIDTLHNVGHPSTRARGTIGGSLAHADPAGELPVAMLALDATMIVASPKGERKVAAKDFVLGAFETALKSGEILVAIDVPKIFGGTAFLELSLRKGDFAIASVAARVALKNGKVASCALVLGGVGERPVRCAAVEALLVGQQADDTTINEAIKALPLEDITAESRQASADYRRSLVPVLARRALTAAVAKAKEAQS